jgi:hypothetical protein
MLLRNDQGEVIFAACRHLPHCQDTTEAELVAIEEGLKLGLQWSLLHFDVETDCAEALNLSQDANAPSHELACLARVNERYEMWLGEYPPDITEGLARDCNPVID